MSPPDQNDNAGLPPPEATTAFAAHYRALQGSVERLRELDVADLDSLVGLVGQASAAYRGCKARIDAIRSLIGEQLDTPAA